MCFDIKTVRREEGFFAGVISLNLGGNLTFIGMCLGQVLKRLFKVC